MVTCAEAFFVESAADVAVTVKLLPAVDPAVYRPLLETVPPVAAHVTAVLELPVTAAANCRVWPGWSVAVVGEIVTLTPGTITTLTVELLVVSATDFAVTWNVPAA